MVLTFPLDCFHTAHFDVAAGFGLLLLPDPLTDVHVAGASVHASAWAEVCTRLTSLGWQVRRDKEGGPRYAGHADGRPVLETESFGSSGAPDDECWRSLCAAVGLVPHGRRHPA